MNKKQKQQQADNEAEDFAIGAILYLLYEKPSLSKFNLQCGATMVLQGMCKSGDINEQLGMGALFFIYNEIEKPNSILYKYIDKDQSTGLFSLQQEYRQKLDAHIAQ